AEEDGRPVVTIRYADADAEIEVAALAPDPGECPVTARWVDEVEADVVTRPRREEDRRVPRRDVLRRRDGRGGQHEAGQENDPASTHTGPPFIPLDNERRREHGHVRAPAASRDASMRPHATAM